MTRARIVDPYRPISDYGVIGNLQTAALISRGGTLDWLCLPHFDSPSLFAALLAADQGGTFSIAPSVLFTSEQSYEPLSNVLVTRFVTASGGAEVVDFMPPYTEAGARGGLYHPELYRGIRGLWGEVPFRVVCDPRPDYGRVRPAVELVGCGAIIRGGGTSVALATEVALRNDARGVVAELTVSHGTERWFVLRQCAHSGCDADLLAPGEYRADETYRRVLHFWRRWADQCRYHGRWWQEVARSALLIKLLTFGPSGALVAAPTTSLPQVLGGPLNWDYRYCWLRDSALAMNALLRLGYADEAQAFFGWLEARSLEPDGLQALYGVDGRRELPEETLPHFEGYRGSRPVGVGHAVHARLPLHVYGDILSAFALLARQRKKLPRKIWAALRRAVDDLCEEWQKPDGGIWEVRDAPRHFVHSKLMAWAALDRAIPLLDPLGQGVGFTTALGEGIRRLLRGERPVVERWTTVKEAIARQVIERGWQPGRGAFTQSYDSDLLDATLLLLPTCQFLPVEDERVRATVELVRKELTADGLVHRYRNPEGPTEGAFTQCSFWLVDALAAIGSMAEATSLFEATLARANHLGLHSEGIHPGTGEFLGNFPQGLAHVGLIGSALTLEGNR
ncbi:MAG: glycoside hydrolase family 15 protein [Candidatus Rokubacteria bacterium]|nr:glycoside hydrolase family 15 protein [Candidatus Rokubacteria bacterium]